MRAEKSGMNEMQTNEFQFTGTPDDLLPLLEIAKEMGLRTKLSLSVIASGSKSFEAFLDAIRNEAGKTPSPDNHKI